MSKRADAPYREGRGGDWRKAKCRLSQEMVIGGWTLPSDGRASIGALHVGFYEDGQLVYAGKVGSGFTRAPARRSAPAARGAAARQLPVRRRPRRDAARRALGRAPELVAQVEFTQWTDEGRMRQPVFLGLRDDRDARHVVRERPGTVEGGGVDTVAAGRPWEALRQHATRTRATSGDEVVDLLGVRLTHPDRVYYPDLGFTKLDLALYYVSIADAVLPHLEGRPLTLVRCPDGLGGETFYQKKAGVWTPPQVRRFAVPEKGEEHLYVDSVPGLVALAQAGILEVHPWNSRVSHLEQPDQVIFDLDPDEALPFSRVAAAARRVRALLRERGLESFVKTTGGKGLHVCVPLAPEHGWEELEDVHARGRAAARARRALGLHGEHGQGAAQGEGLRRLPAQRPRRQRRRRLLHARPRRRAGRRPRRLGRARPALGRRPTSRSRRCRCASSASDRAAPPTRGRATSSSSSVSRRRSRASSPIEGRGACQRLWAAPFSTTQRRMRSALAALSPLRYRFMDPPACVARTRRELALPGTTYAIAPE